MQTISEITYCEFCIFKNQEKYCKNCTKNLSFFIADGNRESELIELEKLLIVKLQIVQNVNRNIKVHNLFRENIVSE